MISKQTLSLITVGIISLGVGYMVSNTTTSRYAQIPNGAHRMPSGQMMHDTDMMDHSSMSMDDMMMTMTKNLQGKTGPEFDRAFIDEMIPHHQGAVEMAQLVLTSTERPELKKMAQDIIDAQTKEIDMMRRWQNEWSK